jgi:hypothetical protein
MGMGMNKLNTSNNVGGGTGTFPRYVIPLKAEPSLSYTNQDDDGHEVYETADSFDSDDPPAEMYAINDGEYAVAVPPPVPPGLPPPRRMDTFGSGRHTLNA